MRVARAASAVALLVLALSALAACAGADAPAASRPTPSPTVTPFPTPTATLAVPSRAVTFTTSDHVLLAGTLYGQGKTFVILSNQTDTVAANWTPIAQQFAARGYTALSYDYRGHGASQGRVELESDLVTDLKAAVGYAQRQGARSIVLVGASIGGAVTANVASSPPVTAVVIVSAPGEFAGLEVSAATMHAISAPKLLMVSQGDGYAQDVQTMYDEARQPKELAEYPGVAHGLALLLGNPDALARVFAFVQQYAPA